MRSTKNVTQYLVHRLLFFGLRIEEHPNGRLGSALKNNAIGNGDGVRGASIDTSLIAKNSKAQYPRVGGGGCCTLVTRSGGPKTSLRGRPDVKMTNAKFICEFASRPGGIVLIVSLSISIDCGFVDR
jgi:hypothetical protein